MNENGTGRPRGRSLERRGANQPWRWRGGSTMWWRGGGWAAGTGPVGGASSGGGGGGLGMGWRGGRWASGTRPVAVASSRRRVVGDTVDMKARIEGGPARRQRRSFLPIV